MVPQTISFKVRLGIIVKQNVSTGIDQGDERSILGARHALGELEATYHIAYTAADIRRYRTKKAVHILAIVCVVISIMAIYFVDFVRSPSSDTTLVPVYSIWLIDIVIIICNVISSRKWGNRPLIGPRDRHLRVYVYADGLVKRTSHSTDVVHWVELKKVIYEPARVGRWFNPYLNGTHIAGLKLRLYGRRTLFISGALQSIEELADRLQHMRDLYR